MSSEIYHTENVTLSSSLDGLALSAVIFVHDYVQLAFDKIGLTVLGDVYVVTHDHRINNEDASFPQALRSCIGMTVRSAGIEGTQFLYVAFDDGTEVRVSLVSSGGTEVVRYEDTTSGRWWAL